MILKRYCLKETISIKPFEKVFCRKFGEHLGWVLFKLPFTIKHHNSSIKGDAKYVVVWLRNNFFTIIEEYQVESLYTAKERAIKYLNSSPVPVYDKIQYHAHSSLFRLYNDVLKFL